MKLARMLCSVAMLLVVAQLTNAEDKKDKRDDAAQRKRDELMMAVQQICPTSGEKLGAHGDPIKVKVGEQVLFLCCKGCLKQKIDPKHWATIHANFAKAQRICPVMKHELPKSPKWTIVEGQVIYICCPPCTKKIAAEPEKYLQAVDKLYAASLDAAAKRR